MTRQVLFLLLTNVYMKCVGCNSSVGYFAHLIAPRVLRPGIAPSLFMESVGFKQKHGPKF